MKLRVIARHPRNGIAAHQAIGKSIDFEREMAVPNPLELPLARMDQSREVSAFYRLLHLYAFASRQFPYQGEVAAPLLPDPVGFSMPCIPSQRTKASNQPVLVVSFGYIPKPWPPCS